MRLAFTSDAVNAWLNTLTRKMVRPEQLMFEPGRDLPAPCINLFDGLPMAPKTGDCAPILELLQHLCGESADTLEGVAQVCAWALRWLARYHAWRRGGGWGGG